MKNVSDSKLVVDRTKKVIFWNFLFSKKMWKSIDIIIL